MYRNCNETNKHNNHCTLVAAVFVVGIASIVQGASATGQAVVGQAVVGQAVVGQAVVEEANAIRVALVLVDAPKLTTAHKPHPLPSLRVLR